MFRLTLKSLSLFFRQMGTMLEAGVPVRRALSTVRRVARGRVRRIADEIAEDLAAGRALAESIERRGAAFPPLARQLVHVGERAGALEPVFLSLADFFELLRSLYRRVLAKMALPLIQFYLAVGIVALVAWIRGSFIAQTEASGAALAGGAPLRILAFGWGLPPAIFFAYFFFTRTLGGARIVHEAVLRLPVLNRLARAFAVARFSWCMSLCSDAGMNVLDSLAMSLDATGNAAFAGRKGRAAARISAGGRISEALAETELFRPEYLEIVSVGEESGKLSETFRHQAGQHFEDAKMGANALGMAVAGLVWVAVAGFIVFQIFSMAAGYLQAIQV